MTRATLEVYRDDGPLARLLAPVGRALAPSALAALAVLPVLAVMAATGADGSTALLAGAVGWLVLVGGASSGGPLERDRFRWMVPALVRTGEYTVLLWISTAACSEGPAAGFVLLVVLAFRHYDLVYRLRYQGRTPPEWLNTAAGGWDGRLVVSWALLAAGALPAGLYALAAILGVLFAAECVASWSGRAGTAAHPTRYDDEGEAE